jgi:hypothetical protein
MRARREIRRGNTLQKILMNDFGRFHGRTLTNAWWPV